MKISLKDKVVLVTGGSRGIGKSIVEALSQAEATIAVHYRSTKDAAEALATKAGHNSRAFQADLGNPQDVYRLSREVIDYYGVVDVLVNNAGIAISINDKMEAEPWQSGWEKTLQVNLIAAAQLCKDLIPGMAEKGNGRIIHIASRAAFRGDIPDYMAYAASKGGMVALSKSIARGYGKQGIKSFVIAPGFTRTEMAQQFIDEFGEELAMKDLALPTLTEPEDVAPTVVFLASGMMDHATGTSIDINGGSYVR
ncbi:MAG: SDR family oxidoreductase [Bacteroidia bacterium]